MGGVLQRNLASIWPYFLESEVHLHPTMHTLSSGAEQVGFAKADRPPRHHKGCMKSQPREMVGGEGWGLLYSPCSLQFISIGKVLVEYYSSTCSILFQARLQFGILYLKSNYSLQGHRIVFTLSKSVKLSMSLLKPPFTLSSTERSAIHFVNS